jgi:hypothetical protein
MEKRIEGKDTLLIQTLAGDHKYNVGEDSPMFGKTYKRYAFGGKVFTTNDEEFANQVKTGGLDTVTLDADAEGQLSLTGYITTKQLAGFAKGRKTLEAIEAMTIEPKVVSEAEMMALLS